MKRYFYNLLIALVAYCLRKVIAILVYFYNILIAIDQLVNAVFAGYPDETLSARCWREKRRFRYVIDYTIFILQKDEQGRRHCEQAYWYEMNRMDLAEEYRKCLKCEAEHNG